VTDSALTVGGVRSAVIEYAQRPKPAGLEKVERAANGSVELARSRDREARR